LSYLAQARCQWLERELSESEKVHTPPRVFSKLESPKKSYQSQQDIIVAKHSSSGDTNQITVYGTHKLLKFKKQ
jgi:hypothetical protein